MQRAQRLGLNITIHAGEIAGAVNVLQALNDYGATRIGHGYRLLEDVEALKEIIRRGVHLECCPTSSLETGGWTGPSSEKEDWTSHPIALLLKAGVVNLGLNSDDPQVFDTSITAEFAIARKKIGLSEEQIYTCNLASIDAAFVDEEEKERLRLEFARRRIQQSSI